MEQYGVPNAVQVTETTYQLLKNRFSLERRGLINIKGKGEVEAYLLLGKQ